MHPVGTSVHWHGQGLDGSCWADGVAGVTQRPIPPGAVFRYKCGPGGAGLGMGLTGTAKWGGGPYRDSCFFYGGFGWGLQASFSSFSFLLFLFVAPVFDRGVGGMEGYIPERCW